MAAQTDEKKNKPPANAYVGLLFVSVAVTIMAIAFLALTLNKYQWTPTP
ncbi:MAG: hypothetical protein O3A00_24900 [Planctomycetota bacterium]|nr:hypothetical protein [Planctomycetota bacterium]